MFIDADSKRRRQWRGNYFDCVEGSFFNRSQVGIRGVFWISSDLTKEQLALVEVFIHARCGKGIEAFYFRAQALRVDADILGQCFESFSGVQVAGIDVFLQQELREMRHRDHA